MNEITPDLNAYGFSTEIRVRLSETDAVGIVFFGSFAIYFDVGRMDYLAHLGLTSLDGHVRDLAPGAVVQHHVDFHRPARYNDTLVVFVRVARLGKTSYTFHFLVNDKRTRARVATGSLTLVWLDPDFRPAPIPEPFRRAIREFEGALLDEPG
ncbi:MAG: thioesterase family protein [bacterium]|nr:acyl-CoA thioesterase [Myxococcales bacterium]MCB9552218.1 acyl-CoA thioesterase [Myxococcales bacterium]